MILQKLVWKSHLILGLMSGIVVFIVSITGALYVFKDDFESFESFRYVDVQEIPFLLPSQVFQIAQSINPDVAIHGILYNGKDKAVEVVYYQSSPLFYGAAYINPYNGELLGQKNYLHSYWGFMLLGHRYLWLPKKIGSPIMKFMVLTYMILLITGVVMWWPGSLKKKGAFYFSKSQNTVIKIKEWHQILGVYATAVILILLFTGSIWLFKGFGTSVYQFLGGEKKAKFSIPLSDSTQVSCKLMTSNPLDSAYKKVLNEYGSNAIIEVHELKSPQSSIFIEANPSHSTYWRMDYLFFDQYTLEEITPDHAFGRYSTAGLPEKVRRFNYDVHTGAVGGIIGKILAAIISLISASLPVTGLWFWLKRTARKRSRN